MNRISQIDLVTVRPMGDHCLRIIADGPWDEITAKIKSIQERLYDAIEFVSDGQFDSRFPEARGGKVVIRLDCYGAPKRELEVFFDRYVSHIRSTQEWSLASERIIFELNQK